MRKHKFGRQPLIALVAVLVLSTDAVAPAYAQFVPAPSPSPASSPAPAPAAPATFNSPFNGTRQVNGAEGTDFTALMALYDTMQNAVASLTFAKNCGGNIAAATAALATATAAFDTAMAQYAFDWSSITYGGFGVSLSGGPMGNKFNQKGVENSAPYKKTDKPAILAALAAQDKMAHPVPACPPATSVPMTPASTPSPKPNDSGVKSALGLGLFLGLTAGLVALSHDRSDHAHVARRGGDDFVTRSPMIGDR